MKTLFLASILILLILPFITCKGARFIPKPSVSIYKHKAIGHPTTLARPSSSSSTSHSSSAFRSSPTTSIHSPSSSVVHPSDTNGPAIGHYGQNGLDSVGHYGQSGLNSIGQSGQNGPDWIGHSYGQDSPPSVHTPNRILTSPYAASLNPILPEPNPSTIGKFSDKPTGVTGSHSLKGSSFGKSGKFVPGIVLSAPLFNGGIESLERNNPQVFGSQKYQENDLSSVPENGVPVDGVSESGNPLGGVNGVLSGESSDEESDYFDPFFERAEYYRTLGIPRPEHARNPPVKITPNSQPGTRAHILPTTPEPTVVYESTKRMKSTLAKESPKAPIQENSESNGPGRAPHARVTYSADTFGPERRGQDEVVHGVSEKKAGRLTLNQISRQESLSNTFDTRGRQNSKSGTILGDIYFIGIVAGVTIASIFGAIGTGYCVYKFNQHNKAAADVDYPAYGVVGPVIKDGSRRSPPGSADRSPVGALSPVGDRKLAQNAEMYHYQHQKQQITNSVRNGAPSKGRHQSVSDQDSEEENEEVDYIVYECPGLASTGEMEVKNPLFQDDSTPNSPMKTPVKTPTKKHSG